MVHVSLSPLVCHIVLQHARFRAAADQFPASSRVVEGDVEISTTSSQGLLDFSGTLFCLQADKVRALPGLNENVLAWHWALTVPVSTDRERLFPLSGAPAGPLVFAVDDGVFRAIEKKLLTESKQRLTSAAPLRSTFVSLEVRRKLLPEIVGFEDANAAKYSGVLFLSATDLVASVGCTQIVNDQVEFLRIRGSGDAPASKPAKPPKGTPPELLPEADMDADPFKLAGCACSVTFRVSQPFTPSPRDRIRVGDIATHVAALQSAAVGSGIAASDERTGLPSHRDVVPAPDAYEEFERQVTHIAERLRVDLRRFISDQEKGQDGPAASAATAPATTTAALNDELSRDFIYELNHSGRYVELKERMKRCICRIVKEKFDFRPSHEGTGVGSGSPELDRFVDDVYVHLVSKLRETYACWEDVRAKELIKKRARKTDWADLAMCAELEGDFSTAEGYLMQNILHRSPVDVAETWLELAAFYLRSLELPSAPAPAVVLSKAHASLRRILKLDDNSIAALRSLAVLSLEADRYEEAEVFLQASIDILLESPSSSESLSSSLRVLDWLLLLFTLESADQHQRCVENRRIFLRSVVGKDQLMAADRCALTSQLFSELLRVGAGASAERLLLHAERLGSAGSEPVGEELSFGLRSLWAVDNTHHSLLQCKLLFSQQDWQRLVDVADVETSRSDPAVGSMVAQAHFRLHHFDAALQVLSVAIGQLESQISGSQSPSPETALLKRKMHALSGQILMSCQEPPEYELAAAEFLSAGGFFGYRYAGMALCKAGHFRDAELCLDEANRRNPLDCIVWSYLTLTACFQGHAEVAESCLMYARKCGLTRVDLLLEICAALADRLHLVDAAEALLLSMGEDVLQTSASAQDLFVRLRRQKGDNTSVLDLRHTAAKAPTAPIGI